MQAQSSSRSGCVWEGVFRRQCVELVCASGDQRENVVCVAWCAEVRGFPARPDKEWLFPTDDVNCRQLLA